jgi:hypothetical protein
MNILNNSLSSKFNLIEYLLTKLEVRVKSFHRSRLAFNNIFDIQDLVENKQNLNKHFLEIQDDLSQAIGTIRALLTQNKDFHDHIIYLDNRVSNFENKTSNQSKTITELVEKNNSLLSNFDDLRNDLGKLRQKNNFYNEKNNFLQNELKMRENELEDYRITNLTLKDRVKILLEENELLKLQFEKNSFNQIEKNEICNQSPDTFRTKDEKFQSEYDNIKSILEERENNKKLIGEKIKNFYERRKENISEDITYKITNCDENKNFNPIKPDNNLSNKNNFQDTKSQHISYDKFNREDKENSVTAVKNRTDYISKLLLKAVESTENINFMNKKFGNDFMQKILNKDVDEEFLNEIEKTLHELGNSNNLNSNLPVYSKPNAYSNSTPVSYKFDDNFSNRNLDENQNILIVEENQENQNPTDTARTYISNNNEENTSSSYKKNLKKKKMNSGNSLLSKSFSFSSKVIDDSQYQNFESNLRKYKPTSPQYKKNFNNFTNPYGKYFDKKIQSSGSLSQLSFGN